MVSPSQKAILTRNLYMSREGMGKGGGLILRIILAREGHCTLKNLFGPLQDKLSI